MIHITMSKIAACVFLVTIWLPFEQLGTAVAGNISPKDLQRNRLSWIEMHIQQYASEHHKLPERLADLPKQANRDNDITDGWGTPIDYRPQSDGSVILTSEGPAGTGNFRSIQFSIVPNEDEFAKDTTFDMMYDTEGQLRDFFKNHHHMPHSLSEIQLQDWTFDGWNKRFEYKVSADGKVTLTSHGKTGDQIFAWQFVVPELQTTKPTTAP